MVLCFEALIEVSYFLKLVQDLTVGRLQYVTSSNNLMLNCSSTKTEKKKMLLSIPYLEIFQKMLKET